MEAIIPVHTGVGIPLGERYDSSATMATSSKDLHQQSAFTPTKKHIGSIHLPSAGVSYTMVVYVAIVIVCLYTACAQHSCACNNYELQYTQ